MINHRFLEQDPRELGASRKNRNRKKNLKKPKNHTEKNQTANKTENNRDKKPKLVVRFYFRFYAKTAPKLTEPKYIYINNSNKTP